MNGLPLPFATEILNREPGQDKYGYILEVLDSADSYVSCCMGPCFAVPGCWLQRPVPVLRGARLRAELIS